MCIRDSFSIVVASLVALLTLAAGCATSSAPPGADGSDEAAEPVASDFKLAGTFWKLSSLEGFGGGPDAGIGTASLSFSEDGRTAGITDGCNGASAEVSIGDTTISAKLGPQTLVGCVDEYNLIRFFNVGQLTFEQTESCLLYTSPSPRDATLSRMPSSA